MPTSEPPRGATGDGLDGLDGPARALLAHAGYACRHSGVCCSSNWEIAVDDALHDRLHAALAAGTVSPVRSGVPALVSRPGLPAGHRSVLGRAGGRCVFQGTGADACRLHAWGGAAAKPVACRQFPWIAVHDPRGTSVSLSHVCPTAAALLHEPALLVLAPLAGAASRFDGLDVRRALPPAIDGRRLLDWDALTAWETQALDACARAAAPGAIVADLRALRAHATRWSPGGEPLSRWIASWTPEPAPRDAPPWRPDPALDRLVRDAVPDALRDSVPEGVAADPAPGGADGVLVRRYVAARLVACWPLHYGTGLATVLVYVEALLAVLAAEIARRAGAAEGGAAALAAAIAETDRLVLHLAAPDALAHGLDAWARRRDAGL